ELRTYPVIISSQTKSPLACAHESCGRPTFAPNKISKGAFRMPAIVRRLCVFVFLLAVTAVAHAAPVLMISIDGLKPEYITQADAHGMKIPFLRTLVANGTYAD